MTEETIAYTAPTYYTAPTGFHEQAAAIIAATEREYWEKKHRELVRLDNWLCETFDFSRSGMVKGEKVTVKQLRRTVDKTG